MHSTHIPPGIIQSHSDIPQTPPRHLPDTLQTPQNIAHFDQSKATRGKKEQTNKKCLIGCLSIACTPYPPDNIQIHSDNHQAPLRHFPDNLQTYRGTWERRNQLIKITLIGFMSINITLYPQPILIDLGLSAICRMVSKRCPEGVWMTLGTAWMVIMPNQLLKLQ